MYAAKIENNIVRVFEIRTGSIKRSIGCSNCKGAVSANVTGDQVVVTGGDGRVRVYDIRTGSLRRTL